jgi:tRNA (uracil-5-)-methyltransferase TRM9
LQAEVCFYGKQGLFGTMRLFVATITDHHCRFSLKCPWILDQAEDDNILRVAFTLFDIHCYHGMNKEVIEKLVAVNLDFYERIGPFWNLDFDYAWDGWDRSFAHMEDLSGGAKVLDVGGGNARLATYLQKLWSRPEIGSWHYTCTDFSPFLLSQARELCEERRIDYELVQHDILTQFPASVLSDSFDVATCFGIFHHVPGYENRKQIFQRIADTLKPGGLLIVTLWQFWKVPRLMKRYVEFDSPEFREFSEKWGLVADDFEQGDAVLNWVKRAHAHRYAHQFSDEEINDWEYSSALKRIDDYESDGRLMCRNRYLVFRKDR